MDVLRPVRVLVVVAVIGRPPEHALLGRRLSQQRQQELGHAGQPVGAMAEVAVEAGRDGEHPQVVGAEAEGDALPGEADGEDAEGRDMDEEEADERRRADLLPPAYLEALARLQDNVDPFPLADVERIVQEELGVRLSKAFESFETEAEKMINETLTMGEFEKIVAQLWPVADDASDAAKNNAKQRTNTLKYLRPMQFML